MNIPDNDKFSFAVSYSKKNDEPVFIYSDHPICLKAGSILPYGAFFLFVDWFVH